MAAGKKTRTALGLASRPVKLSREFSRRGLSSEPAEALIESAPDGIVVLDSRGRIHLVNRRFEELSGYGRLELAGESPEVLVPVSFRSRYRWYRRRYILNPRSAELGTGPELQVQTKAGGTVPVEIRLAPAPVPEPGSVIAIVREAGESRYLQDKSRRLAAMAEVADDAIFGVALDGTILFWNAGAEKTFGYTAEEAEGRSTSMLSPPELKHERFDLTARLIRGERIALYHTRRVRKDGREIAVSLTVTPVRDPRGKIKEFAVTARDISAIQAVEQQLRQAQKIGAVGQLTGGVAHDFNNLLTVIMGNLQVLGRKLEGRKDLARLTDTASRAARRGADLTKRLLAFARKQPLQPRVVDVNERLGEMQHLLRRALGEHIELASVFAKDLSDVCVDPIELEASVLNLALNARDAMPDGGRLMIETSNQELDEPYIARHPYVKPGPYVLIAVSDTGSGISPENLERVFEPFFTTKETGKGSGLGLSMVYGFIKQSGGSINIYSEVGRGTVVKLYLPKASGGVVLRAAAVPAEMPGGRESILLVEDDLDVRSTVSMLLRDLGYDVVETANGREALEVLESGRPADLLLTDVVMPGGLNGDQLASRARTLRPAMKVLYTSGYTKDSMRGTLEEGAVLLSKPYQEEDLARTLRRLLDA